MREPFPGPPAHSGRGGAASARDSTAGSRTVQESVEGAVNWIRLACVLSLVVYAVLPGIPGTGRGTRLAIDEAVLLVYPLAMAVGLRLPRTRALVPAVATVVDPLCITAMVAQTGGLDSEIYLVFFPAIASVALRYGGSLTAGIPCFYALIYTLGCWAAGSLHGAAAFQTLGWRLGYFVICGTVVSVLTTVRSAAESRADLLDSVRTVTASILSDDTQPDHLRVTLMRLAMRMGAAAVHLVRVVPEDRLELLASGGPGASSARPNTVLTTAFAVRNSAGGYQAGTFDDGLSWLGIALWNADECTGVILVETGTARISRRLTDVLPDAARSLAVGLSKLQRSEEQQQRIEELDAINQILWDGLRQPTVESVLTALHRGVAQGIAVGTLRLVQQGQQGTSVLEVDRHGVRRLDEGALGGVVPELPAAAGGQPQGELFIRGGVAATSVVLGDHCATLLWQLPAILPPRDRTFLTLASRAGAILLRTISLYEEVADAASRSAQEVRTNVGLLESVRVLADRLRMLLEGGQRLLAAHGPDAVRQVAVEVALNLDAVRGAALVGAGGAISASSGSLAAARLMTVSEDGTTLVWDHGDEMRIAGGGSMLWDTIEISGDSALESVEAFVAEVSDIDDESRTWLATLVQLTTAAMVNASLELRERMLDVQRERLRLAEELHDTVAQQLYRVGLLARHASTTMNGDATLRGQVDEIRLLASSATSELRRAISATTSLSRSSARVVDDMLPHVQRLRDAGVSAEMVVLGDEHALPEGARRALVELAREGVQNVLKHSGARHAILRVNYGVREVSVTLEDDGAGSRQGGVDDGPSLGLRLIRQRLELLGGGLQAGPLEDGGFALRGDIPLQPAVRVGGG
ncbi:MAG TPA: histidine kinase [Candidatus Dormibacteraeota bacterium]